MKTLKLISLIMALVLSLTLAACNSTGGGETTPNGSNPQSTPASSSPAESTPEENPEPEYPELDYMSMDLSKYVSLGQYKDLVLSVTPKKVVDDAYVQEVLKDDLIYYGQTVKVTDRAVTKEDTVSISFVGLLDGIPFEGGTGDKDNFTIYDGGGFIDGFADGIVGATPGKEIAVELKFPEDYYEELAGKPVTFMVTVVHIYEAKELTDEVAAELTGNKDMTAEGLIADYRARMEESIKTTYDEYKINMTWEKIFSNAKEIEMPTDLIKSYYDVDVQYYSSYAMMYGMSYEDILKMIGMTDDDVYNRAHDNVLTDMIVYSVIKAENFSITDAEYDELLTELAESSGYSKDKILETYTEEKLSDMFTYTKLYEEAANWQKYIVKESAEG